MADAGEFEPFYRAAYPRTVAQLYALTGSLAEAEDLAQEAFVRAMGRWDQLRDYDAPDQWVRRVAFNLAASGHRRALRARAALTRLTREEVPAVDVEGVALITALRQLPLRYRQVLVLHYLVDLSVAEIAAELDLPEGTVKTRLARGRRALAPLVAPVEPAAVTRDEPGGGERVVVHGP